MASGYRPRDLYYARQSYWRYDDPRHFQYRLGHHVHYRREILSRQTITQEANMESQTLGQNNRAFRVIEAGAQSMERDLGLSKADRAFNEFYEPVSDLITATVMLEIIEWPYTKLDTPNICFPGRRA